MKRRSPFLLLGVWMVSENTIWGQAEDKAESDWKSRPWGPSAPCCRSPQFPPRSKRKGQHLPALSCMWGLPKFLLKFTMFSTLIVYMSDWSELVIFLWRWCHSYFSERRLLAFLFTPEIPRNHSGTFKIHTQDIGLVAKYQQGCPRKSLHLYRWQENMQTTVIISSSEVEAVACLSNILSLLLSH